MTLEEALALIAEKAGKGGGKKPAARAKSAAKGKSTAKKKA